MLSGLKRRWKELNLLELKDGKIVLTLENVKISLAKQKEISIKNSIIWYCSFLIHNLYTMNQAEYLEEFEMLTKKMLEITTAKNNDYA